MSILINSLPNSVMIGGQEVGINTDFRASLRFEMMLQDNTMSDVDVVKNALDIYYGDSWRYFPAECFEEACERLDWFYRCGRDLPKSGKSDRKPLISYEHDGEYIYAALLKQGIDIQEIDYLHWWKFRAIFDSLPEDEKIMQIMKFRAVDIGDVPKEKKEYYRKMKKLYAIPEETRKSDRQKQIEEILLNGGDLSVLNGKD